MRKLAYAAFLAAVVLSLGCAITNYPLITDSAGPYGGVVVDSYYDKAYVIPSSQIATIYANGSDELYTEVVQDWKGDRRLYTYNNFDSSGALNFLAQTYCDPTRQTNCAVVVSWDPDLPDAYPISPTGQSGSASPSDDPFDGVIDSSCPGYRSLSILLSVGSRIGECGSGVMAAKQEAALEFSLLGETTFRGRAVYQVPFNSAIAEIRITGANGASDLVPIYGSYTAYIDNDFRTAVEATPNWTYQARWLNNWLEANGSYVEAEVTYGSLEATWQAHIQNAGALSR